MLRTLLNALWTCQLALSTKPPLQEQLNSCSYLEGWRVHDKHWKSLMSADEVRPKFMARAVDCIGSREALGISILQPKGVA